MSKFQKIDFFEKLNFFIFCKKKKRKKWFFSQNRFFRIFDVFSTSFRTGSAGRAEPFAIEPEDEEEEQEAGTAAKDVRSVDVVKEEGVETAQEVEAAEAADIAGYMEAELRKGRSPEEIAAAIHTEVMAEMLAREAGGKEGQRDIVF